MNIFHSLVRFQCTVKLDNEPETGPNENCFLPRVKLRGASQKLICLKFTHPLPLRKPEASLLLHPVHVKPLHNHDIVSKKSPQSVQKREESSQRSRAQNSMSWGFS